MKPPRIAQLWCKNSGEMFPGIQESHYRYHLSYRYPCAVVRMYKLGLWDWEIYLWDYGLVKNYSGTAGSEEEAKNLADLALCRYGFKLLDDRLQVLA